MKHSNLTSLPLVSICIPAYNAEKYISASIDSLLKQSYSNLEIIIVNDGSTDGTAKILESYKPKGIVVVEQENKGQCAAANRAFKEANGEYIKFFDADDLLSEYFIEKQVEVLKDSDEKIASAEWGRFYDDNISTFKLNKEPVWKTMKPIDWLVESLWNGPNMMQCGLWLIPRKILERSGLWDERLSLINDFEFFIRVLLHAEEIIFAEGAILFYRSGLKTSLSGTKSRNAYESAYLSTKLGIEHLLAFEDSQRTRKVSADCMQLWKYDFFPRHMDLFNEAEKIIEKLGGSNYPLPAGGFTRILSKIIGWKATNRIKSIVK